MKQLKITLTITLGTPPEPEEPPPQPQGTEALTENAGEQNPLPRTVGFMPNHEPT